MPVNPPAQPSHTSPTMSAADAAQQVCALCCRDWRAGPATVLCRACVDVDDLLARRAGSQHFLPHIVAATLDQQPQQVMACALHSVRYPNDTGFYGVHQRMSGLLAAAGRARRAALGQTLLGNHIPDEMGRTEDTDHRGGEAPAAVSPMGAGNHAAMPQPTLTASLAAFREAVSEHFRCCEGWLAAQVESVAVECAELDRQRPAQRSDFSGARLVAALTRLARS